MDFTAMVLFIGGQKLAKKLKPRSPKVILCFLFFENMFADDTIGCYFSHKKGQIGYTKNGENLGIMFENVEEKDLYPVVGLGSVSAEVRTSLSDVSLMGFKVVAFFAERRFMTNVEKLGAIFDGKDDEEKGNPSTETEK